MIKNYCFLLILLASILVNTHAKAQTGTIKGTIKDAKTKEVIIGATVLIEVIAVGTVTDVDGTFSVTNIPIGTYDISVSFMGYETKKIDNITIQDGKIIVINAYIDEDNALGEVVVTGRKETNTEIAVISEIKEAQQVAVGVSSEQITKNQDRDASQVARRVSGVSIIDNRFVLVRGLGQRYNTVLINDVITPSTEVDSRAFSFDMVPSQIIDRMMIYKSGAGELPGDFAGGVIKIYTRKAPETNFTNFTFGTGVRANTTFTTVQEYGASGTDFLGFDNGTRNLPNLPNTATFQEASIAERADFASRFKNNWSISDNNVSPDARFNFGLGRRFDIGKVQMGVFNNINYSNTSQFADVAFGKYENGTIAGKYYQSFKDEQFIKNARLGIVSNWSAKFTPKFSLELKNMFNQMGMSETVVRNGNDTQANKQIRSYSQRYETRSIYTGQLVGKHDINDRLNINWQLGLGYTNRKEPDWKRLVYSRVDATQDFSVEATGAIIDAGRFFSNLNETTITAASNAEYLIRQRENKDENIKLKFGFYTENKRRNFDARFFGYSGGRANTKSSLLETIFSPENVGIGGFQVNEGTQSADKYTASNTLAAAYAGLVMPITNKFNLNAGLRAEFNQQQLSSAALKQNVNNPKINLLPSVNLSYNLSSKQLLRVAYAYTVNRPELRELAPFAYYDFNFNALFSGNENLTTATIHNVDARYEIYPSLEEMITFGVFYKNFNRPIETYLTPTSAGDINYTSINAKNATNYGVEIEFRKGFANASSSFIKNLSFVANASYILSNVTIGDVVKISKVGSLTGESVTAGIQENNRPMANQSPYVVNAAIYYNNTTSGLQVNLLYNVFGKRIFAVGNNLSPTIYEMPRNVIDLNITKSFGTKMEIRLNIQDILNQASRLEQDYNKDGKITNADNQPVRTFKRGTYFTISAMINI